MARTNSPFSLNFANPRVEVIPAIGGLDITTPPVLIPAGSLIAGVNFVAKQSGGYDRIAGYERFDGSASPSESKYFSVVVDREVIGTASTATVGSDSFTVLGIDGSEIFLNGEPSTSIVIGASITLVQALIPSQRLLNQALKTLRNMLSFVMRLPSFVANRLLRYPVLVLFLGLSNHLPAV